LKYLESRGWESSVSKGSIGLFQFLESRRKAKYFRWLTERARISYEYVFVAWRYS